MSPAAILLVVRDSSRRQALARSLARLGADIRAVADLPSRLEGDILVAEPRPFEGSNGAAVRAFKKAKSGPGVILLAEKADNPLALRLLRDGTIDDVVCPDNDLHVVAAAAGLLKRRELRDKVEALRARLRALKDEGARCWHKARELEEVYDTTIENLMTALDLRDVETYGHSQTVAKYSQVLAGILGIRDRGVLDHIRKGALLHDIGKIAIPDVILKKPGSLNGPEWEKIRLHPALGFGLIKEIKLVQEVGNIILHHHEHYDGTGYPNGLKQDLIPLEARIFALADALDAITSHRPYRKPRDFRTARREIQRVSGSQFDPVVVDAFTSLELAEWEKIRYESTTLLSGLEYYRDVKA